LEALDIRVQGVTHLRYGCRDHGGTAKLVRRGIVHQSVPIVGLTHLEATAIHTILAGKPVKFFAAYLSFGRTLIGVDLDACFGGGLPVLLAGDLNAKPCWLELSVDHEGETHALLRRRKPLSDLGPDNKPTNSYHPSVTPDVLDIVVTSDLRSPVHLASCLHYIKTTSLYSSSQSFHHPPVRPTSDRLTGPNSKLTWKQKLRLIRYGD
jgi:hypothetical protein